MLFNKSDEIVLLFSLLVVSVPFLSSDQFEERKRMFCLSFLMPKTPTSPSALLPGDRWVLVLSEDHCLYVYKEGKKLKNKHIDKIAFFFRKQ